MDFKELSQRIDDLFESVPDEVVRDFEVSSTTHPGVICGYFIFSEKPTETPKPFKSGSVSRFVKREEMALISRINEEDERRENELLSRAAQGRE